MGNSRCLLKKNMTESVPAKEIEQVFLKKGIKHLLYNNRFMPV